jgi:hypothetical protein
VSEPIAAYQQIAVVVARAKPVDALWKPLEESSDGPFADLGLHALEEQAPYHPWRQDTCPGVSAKDLDAVGIEDLHSPPAVAIEKELNADVLGRGVVLDKSCSRLQAGSCLALAAVSTVVAAEAVPGCQRSAGRNSQAKHSTVLLHDLSSLPARSTVNRIDGFAFS